MDTVKKQKAIAQKVRRLISESAFTNEDVADLLGVSTRLIYYWQNGERVPNVKNLSRLSQLFNVYMESILG